MTNLSEDELLEWLEDGLATHEKIRKYQGKLCDKEIDKGIQAYKQIMALIKKPNPKECDEEREREVQEMYPPDSEKPEVTEGWIEEKAKELHDKAYDAYPSIRSAVYWKDFIRSLVKEIK